MSFRDKFKKKEALLSRQHKNQIRNKDSGTSYPTVILKDKLPAGVEVWRCNASDHIIDILPFFAGPNFPIDTTTGTKLIEEGDPVYVLDLLIHKNIGPMKVPVVCPNENYGLPCPICEYMVNNRLDKEDCKLIKTKRTTYYLIWVHDSRETEKKGIYLWEASHFIFEEKLNVIAKMPRGGGAINFAHPDSGQSIAFTKKSKGGTNVEYLGHRLVPREVPIPEKLLDMVFPIDTVIKTHPTYEEIDKMFNAQKAKLSVEGEVDSAGQAFQGSDDDTPDWMKTTDGEDDGNEMPDPPKKTIIKKKPPLKKKLVLKKK